jgi:hypothetical protein
MPLISKPIPGFYNGVSQQSPTLRLETQAELQENALGDLVDGLIKRQNTEHLAVLDAKAATSSHVHKINRDLAERYLVTINSPDDSDPVISENYPTQSPASSWSVGTDPGQTMDLVNDDDYYTNQADAMIQCEVTITPGAYKVEHHLIDSATASAPVSDDVDIEIYDDTTLLATISEIDQQGNTTNQWLDLGTYDFASTKIVLKMYNRDTDTSHYALADAYRITPTTNIEVFTLDGTKCDVKYGTLDGDMVYTRDDSVLEYLDTAGEEAKLSFKSITVADYTFIVNTEKVTALKSDTTTGTISSTVQGFLDLPASPSTGDIVEITGDDSSGFDNYYVKYDGSTWNECVKPGLEYKIDPETMPHRLVRTGDNEFTFAPVDWGEREIGDEVSCPTPSFIDNKVSNLFFYKNRLVFLSVDNIIFSRAGDFFNFWTSTALDVLDDDPIDQSCSVKQVENLRAATMFDKSLLLLADQQQFDISSGDSPLTPKTVALTPTTAFEICTKCEPENAGANVYFVSPKDDWAAIREYFVQPDSLLDDAGDVTAHVPRYIPTGYLTLAACNSMDVLFCHSDSDPSTLFVYKYYWSGEEKPQSAWCKWTFDCDILGMAIISSTLYLVTKRDTEVCLEKIRLEKVTNGNLAFRTHLDRLVEVQGSYNSGTDRTTWTLPYTETDTPVIVDPDTGRPLAGVAMDSGSPYVTGDSSAKTYLIGKEYTMRFRPTEWYLKNQQGVAITDGRLQIRSLTLSFTDTGYFRVEVTPLNRDTLTHEYTATYVGISTLGSVSLATGEEKFLIMAKSKGTQIDIVNDTYLPVEIQTGSYEGYHHSRSKIM